MVISSELIENTAMHHTGSFSWTVEGSEEIDEECNRSKAPRSFAGNQEAKTCCKQSPSHVREGEE